VKEIGTIGHIRLPQHLSTMQAESRLRQALHKSVSHHLVCAAGQQLENLETHQFPKETGVNDILGSLKKNGVT
jgi:hypothetical protein